MYYLSPLMQVWDVYASVNADADASRCALLWRRLRSILAQAALSACSSSGLEPWNLIFLLTPLHLVLQEQHTSTGLQEAQSMIVDCWSVLVWFRQTRGAVSSFHTDRSKNTLEQSQCMPSLPDRIPGDRRTLFRLRPALRERRGTSGTSGTFQRSPVPHVMLC